MYIIYSQCYDDIELYYCTNNLQEAEDYSELMGCTFKEVSNLPSKTEWPKKIPCITYWAECYNGKLKTSFNKYFYYDTDISKDLKKIRFSEKSITYHTNDLSDEAKQYFDDYISKFKISVKPGSDGTLNVIGFVKNVEED